MTGIQICQTETVYRYADINRAEAIRVLVDEPWNPKDTEADLTELSDQELCDLLQERLVDGTVDEYFESEVLESDNDVEWSVEITKTAAEWAQEDK